MASIDSLKASDGTGSASVATVQSVRAPLATTLIVDTVQGINNTFHATMGTPHTFVDPVTSETITVISEATAVDFQGHVDGTNLEIDQIAPGYTDNGSSVNDIVIIKPTTQWADEVADVLEVQHKDDGTHADTITTDTINENTLANGVTIDGLSIKDGKLNTNDSVVTANVTDSAITPAKIDWASTGADGGIWWEELGRTTLGSAGDTISVTPISARKYLRILLFAMPTGGTMNCGLRLNNDTSTNYCQRYADNDSADSGQTSATAVFLDVGYETTNVWSTVEIVNVSAAEKPIIASSMCIKATGAGTVPIRRQTAGKWANTAAQITRVDVVNTGTGDFAIGSELVVLGHN